MTSKIPEDLRITARKTFALAREVEEKKKEFKSAESAYQLELDTLHEHVLKLIGIEKETIYTFPAGLLGTIAVDAKPCSIEVTGNGEIYVDFSAAYVTLLLTEPEPTHPIFKIALSELINMEFDE